MVKRDGGSYIDSDRKREERWISNERETERKREREEARESEKRNRQTDNDKSIRYTSVTINCVAFQ